MTLLDEFTLDETPSGLSDLAKDAGVNFQSLSGTAQMKGIGPELNAMSGDAYFDEITPPRARQNPDSTPKPSEGLKPSENTPKSLPTEPVDSGDSGKMFKKLPSMPKEEEGEPMSNWDKLNKGLTTANLGLGVAAKAKALAMRDRNNQTRKLL